jgi:very-short-patch-repair endonuclease
LAPTAEGTGSRRRLGSRKRRQTQQARDRTAQVEEPDVDGDHQAAGDSRDDASPHGRLESAFLRLCRRHGISRPEVDVSIGSWLVDFLWRDAGLVVETDGYRYHRGRQAFEDDRRRDLDLRMPGYEVVRLTHDQVLRIPGQVAGAIEETLSRLRA